MVLLRDVPVNMEIIDFLLPRIKKKFLSEGKEQGDVPPNKIDK